MAITKNTPIQEIIKNHPETAKVFKKYNLECTKCKGAVNDTVENCSISYGLDMNTLLNDLKKAVR